MPFGRAYVNSFYIAVLVVAGQLFTCSLAGYAFAKIQFPFRDTLFVLFLMTLVIPFHVTIIPLFLMMKQLGWLDSHLSLIVPSALFDAFGVFFLRQFIRGLPRELDDAAVMDGANPWIAYRRIIVPLIKPALSALAIFSFLGQWNNFFMPLIFLNSAEKATVPLLIASFQGQWLTDWPVMLASVSIAVVPVLVVFVIAQRYIIEGAALSGIAH
jgi:multiple sugar transport system permease protein